MKSCKVCGHKNDDHAKMCIKCGSNLAEEKRNILPCLLIVLAGSILIGIVAFILFYNSPSQIYRRQISQGDKYMQILRYENAILSYQAAVDAMPEKETGYLKLANAFYMVNDYQSAKAILEKGLRYVNSVKMEIMLEDFAGEEKVNGENGTYEKAIDEEELKKLSQEVKLYSQMLGMFSKYTYGDYRRDYGEPTWINTDNERFQGSWTGIGFELLYYNSLENPDVINTLQGTVHTYSKPTEIIALNPGVLFQNYQGTVTRQKLEELCGEALTVAYSDEINGNYVSFTCQDCVIEIETDPEGNVIGETGWARIRPVSYETYSEEEKEEAVVSGYIKDASTGAGIYGALLTARKGGEEIARIYTSGDGSYELQLEGGSYELEISYGSYITEKFSLEVRAGENQFHVNYNLSPQLEQGSIRIVLEWGYRPTDLDSYTDGFFADGSSFHISYQNRTEYRNGDLMAELDVDDTDGYGPETTTIYDSRASFSFRIEDFRAEGVSDYSAVTVKVYLPGESVPQIFTGKVQNFGIRIWNVFYYEDGNLYITDTYE